MNFESHYVTALLMGLLGGVHCVGMCGGIVTALSMGIETPNVGKQKNSRPDVLILLGYNFGRIASYVLLGLIAGGLGSLAMDLTGLQQIRVSLQFISVLVMFAMGLYLAGWWYGLSKIERIGLGVWKRIEPLGRKLIPVRNPLSAVMLGGVWGWLPCGLVYSMLVWAITAADPVKGALIMLAFGLGTLPNLLLMGVFAAKIGAYLKQSKVRQLAGVLVIALACWQLYYAINSAIGLECWYCLPD